MFEASFIRRTSIVLAGALLASLTSPSPLQAEQGETPEEPARGDYRIGAGDTLNIVVWRNAELSMTVPVRPDGWISLPLVNDVRAEGLTPMELRQSLTERLQEFVSTPVVSVIVTQVASFQVSVLGKVRRPGRFPLSGPATVLDLLALAGGPDEFASPDDIVVLREVPATSTYERIPFAYSKAVSSAGLAVNVRVEPGDIIFVP